MSIGINQAIAALAPSSAKSEGAGRKAQAEDGDFNSALDLEKTGRQDRHGKDRTREAAEGTRGEPRHGKRIAKGTEIADAEPAAGETNGKAAATPLSAMIAARALDERAAQTGNGARGTEGTQHSKTQMGTGGEPDIKVALDPATVEAAEHAARNAAGRSRTAQKAEAAGSSGASAPGNETADAAAARNAAARMPDTATITLSLAPKASQAQQTATPTDAAMTPGRDFLQTLAAGIDGDRPQPDAFGRRPDTRPERITVVAQQNIPAPVAQPGPSTAVGLANLISADPGWKAAAAPSFQPLTAQPNLASAHTLKLQLHPAELGMVTANLRFSGEHLTVELRVENGEAYRRLSADSETIVKSLRSMGLNIDQVTIQQPQSSATAQGGADGNNAAAGFGPRDQQAFASANSGGGEGGRASAGNSNESSHGSSEDDAAPAASHRPGDSLYI